MIKSSFVTIKVKRIRVYRLLNNSRSILPDRYDLILFYLLEFEQNVRNIAVHYIQNIQLGEKTKGDLSLYKTKKRSYEKDFKRSIRS